MLNKRKKIKRAINTNFGQVKIQEKYNRLHPYGKFLSVKIAICVEYKIVLMVYALKIRAPKNLKEKHFKK